METFIAQIVFIHTAQKNKLKKHERVCNDYDYYVDMPNEDNKILKYNHGQKPLKASFMIYADLERLLEKMHSCQNNPEKSDTETKIKHTPFGYSLFTNFWFDLTKSNFIAAKVKTVQKYFVKT